jgi:chromosome segregation ATPase
MATLVNMKAGATQQEMHQVAGGDSWRTYDPDDPYTFLDENGQIHILDEGENVFDQVNDMINANNKAAMLEQKAIYKAETGRTDHFKNIRDTSGKFGEVVEWDHLGVTLSRDESATLKELGEDSVKRFREVISQALSSTADGSNLMAFVTGVHKNTGNYHIHAMVHRLPRSGNGEISGPMVDMVNGSAFGHKMKYVQDKLAEAGLDFIKINAAARNIETGKDHFADRSGVVHKDRETGEPLGMDPGLSIIQHVQKIDPDLANMRKTLEIGEKIIREEEIKLKKLRDKQQQTEETVAAFIQVKEVQKEAEADRKRAEIAEASKVEALEIAEKATNEAADFLAELEMAKIELAAEVQKTSKWQEALVEANTQLGDREDEIVTLKDEIEELTEFKEKSNQVINTVKTELKSASDKNEIMTKDLAVANSEIQEARAEFTKLNAENKQLKAEIAANEAVFAKNAKAQAQLNSDLEAARSAEATANTKADKISKKAEDLAQKLETADNTITDVNKNLEAAKSAEATANTKANEISKRAEDLTKELTTASSTIADVSRNLEAAKSAEATANTRANEISKKAEDLTQKLETADNTITDVNKNLEAAKSAEATANNRANEISKKAEDLTKELTTASSTIADVSRNLETAKSQTEKLETANKQLQENSNKSQTELTAFKVEKGNLQKSLREAQETTAQWQKILHHKAISHVVKYRSEVKVSNVKRDFEQFAEKIANQFPDLFKEIMSRKDDNTPKPK